MKTQSGMLNPVVRPKGMHRRSFERKEFDLYCTEIRLQFVMNRELDRLRPPSPEEASRAMLKKLKAAGWVRIDGKD